MATLGPRPNRSLLSLRHKLPVLDFFNYPTTSNVAKTDKVHEHQSFDDNGSLQKTQIHVLVQTPFSSQDKLFCCSGGASCREWRLLQRTFAHARPVIIMHVQSDEMNQRVNTSDKVVHLKISDSWFSKNSMLMVMAMINDGVVSWKA